MEKTTKKVTYNVYKSDYTTERLLFIQDLLIQWIRNKEIELDFIPKGDVNFYQVTTSIWHYEFLQHLINH